MKKTWFITGCSTGIGRGIAQAVLAQGDNAVITARSADKMADLVAQYPDTALAVALEITSRDSIEKAYQAAMDKFGAIDILINNAGHGYRCAVEEGEDAGVEDVFRTNFFGPVDLIKKVLPQMRQRKSGAIVNVTSIAAVRSAVGSGYYAASKSALEMISEALYQEVSPLGIKVMMVEPGAFRTSFYDDAMKLSQGTISDYAATAGTRRVTPADNKRDQLGDPVKGGKLIVDTIQKDVYPRRLALGSDAVKVIETTLVNRLEEVRTWAADSATTDF